MTLGVEINHFKSNFPILLLSDFFLKSREYYCLLIAAKTLYVGMHSLDVHRLVGLVVKASASRAEDPAFESRVRRDFSGVESYQ